MSPASWTGSSAAARRPRVEVRPSAINGSRGQAAVELAAAAGLELENWQADALELMLSTRADGSWACREYAELVGRQQGKSAGIGVPRVLAGLLLFDEAVISWSAHEVATSLLAFGAVRNALATIGEQVSPIEYHVGGLVFRALTSNGKEQITCPQTRQVVRFSARSKGASRGFSGDCTILDETWSYTRAQQAAIAPTQLARPRAQTIYLSSPPLDPDSGEVLFALRARARTGDDDLGYRDWGVEAELEDLAEMDLLTRQAWVADPGRWAAALPALGGDRVTERSVDQLRRELDPLSFAREVLGAWPRQGAGSGRVIGEEAWAQLTDADSQINGAVVFGVDANPQRTEAAIGAAGMRVDGRVHIELADHRAGLGWLVGRCLELQERHEPVAWVIDPSGPAGGIIADLEVAGLNVLTVTSTELGRACTSFYDRVVQQQLRHPGTPALDAAVGVARRRDLGDGSFAWGRRGSKASIAPLVAVTLAAWGLDDARRVEEVPEPIGIRARSSYDLETVDLMQMGF